MQKGPLTNRTLEQSAQCATKRVIYENMFVVSAIVFFIVPMIIVTVLYILIALELRSSSKMNAAISKQTSHLSTLRCTSRTHQQHHHHHHQHHHHHHHNHCQSRHRHRPVQYSITNCSSDEQRALVANHLKTDSLSLSSSSKPIQPSELANQQRPLSALETRSAQPLEANAKSGSLALLEPSSCCEPKRVNQSSWLPQLFSTSASSQVNGQCRCSSYLSTRGQRLAQLEHSQSQQYVEQESRECLSRQHSPLSYHESLIQRQQLQQNSSDSSKTRLQAGHQLSPLSHSASYTPGRANFLTGEQVFQCGSFCGGQQQHTEKQPTQQASNCLFRSHNHRRSASASSKKSVVRMLGKYWWKDEQWTETEKCSSSFLEN